MCGRPWTAAMPRWRSSFCWSASPARPCCPRCRPPSPARPRTRAASPRPPGRPPSGSATAPPDRAASSTCLPLDPARGDRGQRSDLHQRGRMGGRFCGIAADSSVWCWGDNSNTQLSTGSANPQPVPAAVQSLPTGSTWSQIAVSSTTQCAIRSDPGHVGELWCWGAGVYGQLGTGGSPSLSAPVRVGSGSWASVAASNKTFCAISSVASCSAGVGTMPGRPGSGRRPPRSPPRPRSAGPARPGPASPGARNICAASARTARPGAGATAPRDGWATGPPATATSP